MIDRGRFQVIAGAALRIVAGFLFAMHGMEKLFGFPDPSKKLEIASQLGVGGIIELVCGVLIAIGLFTRPAALLASGTMAVAYFQFHWTHFPFAHWQFLPGVNGGEPAVVYCFVFLLFAATGAGPYSVDARRGHR